MELDAGVAGGAMESLPKDPNTAQSRHGFGGGAEPGSAAGIVGTVL